MKKFDAKWYKWIGNSTLAVAVVIGAVALFRTWSASRQLAPGTCPITDNRPWLLLALVLCLVSFVFSILESKSKPKE